jgi:FtsP/CotA-like multicopper oxidase with cupredoxin domain
MRLGLPRTYGVDDFPIILQDRAFDDSGSLVYELDALTIAYGGRGDTIIANGAITPVVKVPAGLVRLTNAQNYDLRFDDLRLKHDGFAAAEIDEDFIPLCRRDSKLAFFDWRFLSHPNRQRRSGLAPRKATALKEIRRPMQ